MREINSMSMMNALAKNRPNSLPCTVRTTRQRLAIKGLVVRFDLEIEPLELLNDRALGCCQLSPEVLIIF